MLLSGSALTSCDDFLTLYPTNQLPEENFWQDKADLENVRAAAYQQLGQSGQTNSILIWGELRSDNLTLNSMSNTDINYLQNAILQPSNSMFDWAGFYTGINFCNLVIEQGEVMTTPGSEVDPSYTLNDYKITRAEMLALRSLYYFYLVRAYRDVPYVTNSIRTDTQARNDLPAAETGVAILGDCIDSLEASVQYAADNFGSAAENKGRFTKLGVHALLADMYLWRACLLKDYMSKDNAGRINISDVAITSDDGLTVTGYRTADSTIVDNTLCNELSAECLQKSVEHATWVIDKMKADYDEDLEENSNNATAEQLSQPYPLILNATSGNNIEDQPYNEIFGSQNSDESIFEVQYDGSSTINSTVNTYLTTYSNSAFNAQIMTLSSLMTQSATTVNPTIGYGKTDFRLWETCNYASVDADKPITKFVLRSLYIEDLRDVTSMTSLSSVSTRSSSSNDAHWPVYRLADVMLIKAEAIARMETPGDENMQEAFQLTNQLFKRNNPALVATTNTNASIDDELRCDRLDATYWSGKTTTELLALVYRERQREFIAEGKRWFDLVRQAEFSNDPSATLSTYASVTSSVRNRLSKIYAFYNPIYSEELKVNGVENGGYLVQNPVWERYSTN